MEMSILSINVNTTGLVGQTVNPRRNTMVTTDSLATITTAGYLNGQNSSGNPILPTDIFEVLYSYSEATKQGTFGIFQITYNQNTGFTLNLWENPGNVLLPVVSGDFAVFNGTSGQIKDAGYSATNAAKTKVVMANGAVVVGNMAVYTDVLGTIGQNAATAINGGNIQAGISGTAGTLASFPATAANGSLILAATNAGGAFNTTISNGTMGQSTVYTIPDIGASTGDIVVSTSAVRMKSVAGASVAGGAASQTVTDAFCTSGSNVIACWNTSANAVNIQKVTPGNGSFVVLSSGDPGASTINYIITK
jgi:hypothetical protein